MVAPFDITKNICTKDGRKASVFSQLPPFREDQLPIYIVKVESLDSTGRKLIVMRSYKTNGEPVLGDGTSKDVLVNVQFWHQWLIESVRDAQKKVVK